MSADQWSQLAKVHLSDHEIHLFIRHRGYFRANELGKTEHYMTLGQLAGAAGALLPGDQTNALTTRYAGEKVWVRATATAGDDLYEHVRELIAGEREDLATYWTMSPTVQKLLNSGDLYEENVSRELRTRKHLRLTLSESAQRRLQALGVDHRSFKLKVEQVGMHVFSTGTAISHVSLSLLAEAKGAELNALELLEGLVALGRLSEIVWALSQNGEAASQPFQLRRLIDCLVSGHVDEPEISARTSTYVYAQLAESVPLDAADLYARHLSRHYGTDYALEMATKDQEMLTPFKTIRHAVSREGVATIVVPRPGTEPLPPFLVEFKKLTVRRHYVPIVLLALHERHFLVDRTSRSLVSPEQSASVAQTIDTFQGLRSDSLVFRICYRFSELSQITMHNELNQVLRRVLNLDVMLAELAGDVAEIESFLRAVETEQSSRRFRWASALGGASLAALTTVTLAKDSVSAYKGLLGLAEESTVAWDQASGGAVILSLAIFAITFCVIYFLAPLGGRRSVSQTATLRAMLENMQKAGKR